MPKALAHCPVCENTLHISELTCGRCSTRIAGNFDSCRFCRLAPEHLAFLETFLRCEGNISRVEKELGLSYPTVRNKLSAALAALELNSEERNAKPAPEAQRRAILEALSHGELSAEEAAEELRHLL